MRELSVNNEENNKKKPSIAVAFFQPILDKIYGPAKIQLDFEGALKSLQATLTEAKCKELFAPDVIEFINNNILEEARTIGNQAAEVQPTLIQALKSADEVLKNPRPENSENLFIIGTQIKSNTNTDKAGARLQVLGFAIIALGVLTIAISGILTWASFATFLPVALNIFYAGIGAFLTGWLVVSIGSKVTNAYTKQERAIQDIGNDLCEASHKLNREAREGHQLKKP